MLRMVLALRPAGTARGGARLDLRTQHRPVRLGLAREHVARGDAGIEAVEVEPDTADELLDLRLAEARIGARGARLRTGVALLDARDQGRLIDLRRLGMGVHHLLHGAHGTPPRRWVPPPPRGHSWMRGSPAKRRIASQDLCLILRWIKPERRERNETAGLQTPPCRPAPGTRLAATAVLVTASLPGGAQERLRPELRGMRLRFTRNPKRPK